jgi:hypothetical protein
VTFAGVMITIAAVLNTLYGIAAIDNANFYANDAQHVFADLRTWGWFLLALGVLQFFAALAIWRGPLGDAGSASHAPAPTRSSSARDDPVGIRPSPRRLLDRVVGERCRAVSPPGICRRVLMMARPGLEPGTPRFSVVCSTN